MATDEARGPGTAATDPKAGVDTRRNGEPSEGPAARDSERPPEDAKDAKEASSGRRRFETMLPGLIRRGLEKGIEAGIATFEKSLETGRETTDAVREVLSEVRAPREVASAVGDVATAAAKAISEAKLPRELA